MTAKRKRPSQDRHNPIPRILAALDSPDTSRRQQAIGDCWETAEYVGAVLAALLRGLNDDDELIRVQAAKGILHAFPSADSALSHMLSNIESNQPKVRLAAIKQITIFLPHTPRRVVWRGAR